MKTFALACLLGLATTFSGCGSGTTAPRIGTSPEAGGADTGSGGAPAKAHASGNGGTPSSPPDPSVRDAASPSPERVCVPGQSVACVGPAGCHGGQACASDGQSYEACECSPEAAGGTTGSVPEDSGAATGGRPPTSGCTTGQVLYQGKCCTKSTCASVNGSAPLCGNPSDQCGGTLSCSPTCPPGGECVTGTVFCSCWYKGPSASCPNGLLQYQCGLNKSNQPQPTIAGCVPDPLSATAGLLWCCPLAT